jgi:glycosyltransferase involved in cell wall biosynthesis
MTRLSVIVVCYKMAEQIGNTLQSLLAPYQRSVINEKVEILVIDNGSPQPLPEDVTSLTKNIIYTYLAPTEAKPSPGFAINQAVKRASSSNLCLMVDGARMLTPGVLGWGLRLLALSRHSIVEVRGWHLGPKWQPESIAEGYNYEIENRLLEKARWKENGYRLFDISASTPQTKFGLSVPAAESNCLFMTRELFDAFGGFDERYAEPGGGFFNLDFYARAVAEANHVWTLLGEGTFHQVHKGAATGLTTDELNRALRRWKTESEGIRGPLPTLDPAKFILAGHMPAEFLQWISRNPPQASSKTND